MKAISQNIWPLQDGPGSMFHNDVQRSRCVGGRKGRITNLLLSSYALSSKTDKKQSFIIISYDTLITESQRGRLIAIIDSSVGEREVH